jgi:CysZ protein
MSFPADPAARALAAQPPPQRSPLVPAAPPGVGDGLRSLFAGVNFVLSNPSVWPLALVPIAIAIALLSGLAWATLAFIPPYIGKLLGHSGGFGFKLLAGLIKFAATAAALLVAALLSFGLAQPLSGPALERLVRRVESSMGAPPWPPTSLFADISRSLQSVLVGYAFGLPILAVLFIIGAIFPPAVVVTFPLKLLVTAILITWDLCDYPLSIRGIRVGDRVSFLKRNVRAVLGFGLGLALLSLIPCALLIILPSGVAGAARLVVLIERWEAARLGAPLRPPV